MDILKHAQNMVARGLAVPFVAASSKMGAGLTSIAAGGDIQWKLVAGSSGIGSGFLVHTVSLFAPYDLQLSVRENFAAGVTGYTDRSADYLGTLDSTNPASALAVWEKYTASTTALTEGVWHESNQTTPTIIDLRENPLVIEYDGTADCIMCQVHNDHSGAAAKWSLQMHGIAWSIA